MEHCDYVDVQISSFSFNIVSLEWWLVNNQYDTLCNNKSTASRADKDQQSSSSVVVVSSHGDQTNRLHKQLIYYHAQTSTPIGSDRPAVEG